MPRRRAQFAFLLAASLWAAPCFSETAQCGADRLDQQVRVSYVHDGDTIKLEDGQSLRLIGINTPELGRGGAPSEALALDAREALQNLLADSPTLALRFDSERRDHYGRLLAHLFLPDGRSIEAHLLEQGLATQLLIPPNVWNLACYQEAERKARSARRGLWSRPEYRPLPSTDVPADARGFRLIQGRVERVGHSAKSVWINLEGGVALRIARNDLNYFSGLPLESLENQVILARGWIYAGQRGPTMRIRHPAALERVH